MRSASRTVESRCAITSVVRPRIRLRERLLHQPLGLGVERRGGLVQDQDRRVLQDRAGDRDPLALAAGEPAAALADHGVVAVAAGRG